MDSLTHFNKKVYTFYVQQINILKVTVLEKNHAKRVHSTLNSVKGHNVPLAYHRYGFSY